MCGALFWLRFVVERDSEGHYMYNSLQLLNTVLTSLSTLILSGRLCMSCSRTHAKRAKATQYARVSRNGYILSSVPVVYTLAAPQATLSRSNVDP
jgi:hypothetical protein